MAGIEDGIAAALAYAGDDSHGYELQSRDYDLGTDCAGLVRLYAASVEGVALSAYPDFHTWNEREVLSNRGWLAIRFNTSSMKRGDVLLRALGDSTGHTVVYLGDGYIVGAEGNWDGRHGDGSGTEVTKRTYYPYDYNWILRPPTWTEDDMPTAQEVADAVVNYDCAGVTLGSRIININTQVDRTNDEVKRTDDCTGRNLGMLDHDKLNYMAAKQAEMYDMLKTVMDKLGIETKE